MNLLHDVICEAVKSRPGAVAVLAEDGSMTTYGQLDALANQYARHFMALKADPATRPYVGILATVGARSIAAVLGVLRAGAAYVPLDEQSPPERLARIVQNTALEVIVADAELCQTHASTLALPEIESVVVLGEAARGPVGAVGDEDIAQLQAHTVARLPQVSDDLAYVLHSSGSTGVPKGIMLTHRNARTFVDWMAKEFRISADDVVMSRAPYKFDLSVFDVFNTLAAGATLVCYDWHRKRPSSDKHSDYVALMASSRATVLYTTPSTFIALMNRGELAAAELCLRQLMYAGEPFAVPQLRALLDAVPGARMANIYGPTETNIITCYKVEDLTSDDPVPLGDVVDDTEILVVADPDGPGRRIADPDQIGELWCRGGTVTLGYLGMPDKTAECLVQSPFHPYPAWLWRTGDFGFRDESGCLHYRGRRDHMVKVKGFRIEIGEIEAALAKAPGIDEFVIVAVADERYGNRLHCFFSTLADTDLDARALNHRLAELLPSYMLPYRYHHASDLPKTSSGKVDRVLLAERASQS